MVAAYALLHTEKTIPAELFHALERLQYQPAPIREEPEDRSVILSAQVISPAPHDFHPVVHSLMAGQDGVRGNLREREWSVRGG